MFMVRMLGIPLLGAALGSALAAAAPLAAGVAHATAAELLPVAGAQAMRAATAPGPGIAAPSTAAAGADSTWRVMVWTDPLTVSVDTASIATRDARRTARVLWDYSAPQLLTASATAPYKSMIGIVVFDCTTAQFGGAGSVAYSGDGGAGEAVAQFAIDPDRALLSTTAPGTLGRDLLTFVCGHVVPHD